MTPILLALALFAGGEQVLTAPSIGLAGYNSGPSVAASSTNFLAAWLVRPPANPRIPGRVAVMPFDENGTEAATEIFLDSALAAPDVGSNGDDYLLAWTVDGAITVRRVDKRGAPLAAAETLTPSLSTGQLPAGGTTRVLWNGAHYVVVAASNVYVNSFVKSAGVVAGLAANGGKTAIAWYAGAQLFLGFADPEAPSAGTLVSRDTIRNAAVFPAAGGGFDVEWLTPEDPIPSDDVTWASPHLVVYSKATVIAQRAVSRTRRRAAAY